jgi:hypothetical protein
LNRMKWLVLIFLFCFLSLPSTVTAKSIFEHQSTFVPENQTVSDVVVIGGDANIAGTVSNSVIVINGDVHIQSRAHVQGFVLIIGGQLQQDAGAEITDDIISISFDKATVNSLIIGGGLIIGIAALQLAATLLMIFIPVLITLLGKRHTAAFVDRHRTISRGNMLYTGFFTGVLLTAASMLLILTVIGIPFILVFAVLILMALALGVTVISQLLGEQFQGTIGKADWMKSAVGAFILASAVNIPFVGLFIMLVIMAFSLGIATTWAVGKIRRKKKA